MTSGQVNENTPSAGTERSDRGANVTPQLRARVNAEILCGTVTVVPVDLPGSTCMPSVVQLYIDTAHAYDGARHMPSTQYRGHVRCTGLPLHDTSYQCTESEQRRSAHVEATCKCTSAGQWRTTAHLEQCTTGLYCATLLCCGVHNTHTVHVGNSEES